MKPLILTIRFQGSTIRYDYPAGSVLIYEANYLVLSRPGKANEEFHGSVIAEISAE